VPRAQGCPPNNRDLYSVRPRPQTEEGLRRIGRSLLTWKGAPWTGATLVLILGALALFVFTGSPPADTATVPLEYATDITSGPADARVVVVEYADFQCEACAHYAPMLASLRTDYKDTVRFVFRFFPLNYHAFGMVSAQAAYAASLQGKFWQMHDLLYENQQEWSESADPVPHFEAYANSLGLDVATFRQDMNAQGTRDLIASVKSQGSQDGVHRTPFFAINGTAIVPSSLSDFKSRIDALP
jgi:protein-disulfide isomerase